ncbi:hypothetical protein [Paenibacillus sp. OV219]|uniref:hypothetical protein n=1 Tax=Paenibacillus sp. OV219 TaxID=1884377 RepID=UPI00116037BE|nr:hypothetical protein [Paenibacillus sp. OV219]
MNMTSIHGLKKPALTGAACLMILLMAGCQLSTGEYSLENNDNAVVSHINSASTNEQSDSPQKALDTNLSAAEVNSGETPANNDATTIADATTESTSTTMKPSAKSPAAKNEKKWDSNAPKLLGIAIGDSKANWDSKLGKPADIYKIDDDKESVTVSEYAAFSVGYGADKKVKFVDVFDKSAGTGLNGLNVGDSQNAVVKSLGKPDIQTASVLAYKGTGALLKLDLDPANNQVLSIKLFSNPN